MTRRLIAALPLTSVLVLAACSTQASQPPAPPPPTGFEAVSATGSADGTQLSAELRDVEGRAWHLDVTNPVGQEVLVVLATSDGATRFSEHIVASGVETSLVTSDARWDEPVTLAAPARELQPWLDSATAAVGKMGAYLTGNPPAGEQAYGAACYAGCTLACGIIGNGIGQIASYTACVILTEPTGPLGIAICTFVWNWMVNIVSGAVCTDACANAFDCADVDSCTPSCGFNCGQSDGCNGTCSSSDNTCSNSSTGYINACGTYCPPTGDACNNSCYPPFTCDQSTGNCTCTSSCSGLLCGQLDACGRQCPSIDIDQCGVCGGNGSSCQPQCQWWDCQGTCNGNVWPDECGVCGGDGSECRCSWYDCDGTCNGNDWWCLETPDPCSYDPCGASCCSSGTWSWCCGD